ncbi:MAG: hypothetical protein HYY37_04735 [Candidatus Aenigmarchaeota archaeon]|nr:hypothetical protein [Candidatus Aenigmarchaeota archaeon]
MKLFVIALLLVGLLFVSGCTTGEQTTIKNQDDAQQAVSNVSRNVEDISATLKEIDESLK